MTKTLQIFGTLAGIIGTITFFIGLSVITIICSVIILIDSFVQIKWGEQKNFASEILCIIIGLIIALILGLNIWGCIAVAVCIGTIVFTIIGWVTIGYQAIKLK